MLLALEKQKPSCQAGNYSQLTNMQYAYLMGYARLWIQYESTSNTSSIISKNPEVTQERTVYDLMRTLFTRKCFKESKSCQKQDFLSIQNISY